MATIDDILSAIDADQDGALDRLFAFLSIPSISAVPAHFPDCERAADWLVAELGELASRRPSTRPKAGRWSSVTSTPVAATRPTPCSMATTMCSRSIRLNLWRNPPFEPKLESGPQGERIVARGASDDKGQLMTFSRPAAPSSNSAARRAR